MTVEKALFYFTHHSESIIQWLFLAILLLAMILVGRSLFGKKKAGAGLTMSGGADAGELQGFLQTILERTSKLEAVSVHGMDPAALAGLEAQVQTLKKDLAARESELAAVAKGGGASGAEGGAAGGAVTAGGETADSLSTRIKELEAKLAEYEILEDDIADLSLYKEENARMRTELDKLKAAPPVEAVAAAPVPTSAAPSPSASSEKIMADFEQAVETQPLKSEGQPVKVESTGNSMADFENTLNITKKMGAEGEAVAESDDLFGEFADEGEKADDALDTSKVMDELSALESLAGSIDASSSVLEDGIDTDKMAAEASSLIKS